MFSVGLYVCYEDNSENSEQILIRISIVVGVSSRNKCVNFGGDRIQDFVKRFFIFLYVCQ